MFGFVSFGIPEIGKDFGLNRGIKWNHASKRFLANHAKNLLRGIFCSVLGSFATKQRCGIFSQSFDDRLDSLYNIKNVDKGFMERDETLTGSCLNSKS